MTSSFGVYVDQKTLVHSELLGKQVSNTKFTRAPVNVLKVSRLINSDVVISSTLLAYVHY